MSEERFTALKKVYRVLRSIHRLHDKTMDVLRAFENPTALERDEVQRWALLQDAQ